MTFLAPHVLSPWGSLQRVHYQSLWDFTDATDAASEICKIDCKFESGVFQN